MDKDLDRRALGLLDDVLEVAPGDRDAWLATRCGDDAVLKERVTRLLGSATHEAFRTGTAARLAAAEPLPERIGAYRITGLIGQGGMGAVYRGERAAGDFKHVAAIKLIRPGALSDTLVARFRRERQTLAELAHPHIARLFDGGETGDRRPYLVMECVDGRPLHVWLAEERPDLATRLALFVKVCRAVGYAHQNLVIHRDLTPANILVDAGGEPKLIDFGIARPVGDAETGAAETATPGFAAPERRLGGAASTLGDIYALGKLLDTLVPEPGPELAAIARRASAPEPELRYPTADALADDVERFRGGQAVRAMGGGRAYAMRKFIMRNRGGVGAAAAALLLIVAALVATLVANRRAEVARRAEAARFEEVRSLAGFMLFDLDGRLARVVGNADARARLADRAQRYLSALAASPDTDPDLRLEAGRGFIALARVQGVPGQANLGRVEQARANLRNAITMLSAPDLPNAPAAVQRAEARALLAMIEAHGDADVKASDRTLALAAVDLRAVPESARGPGWQAARSRLRRSQLELTILGNRPDDMPRLARTVEAEIETWDPAARRSPAAAFDRAIAMHYRGMHGYFTDQLEAGVDAFADAQRRFTALDKAHPNDPATLYWLAWNAYMGSGTAEGLASRTFEARRFLATARGTVDRLLSIEPNDRALQSFAGSVLQLESQAMAKDGRFAEALNIQRDVVGKYRRAIGPERKGGAISRLATANVSLSRIAILARDRATACRSTMDALTSIEELRRRHGQMIGSFESYGKVLAGNADACARGLPAQAMRDPTAPTKS